MEYGVLCLLPLYSISLSQKIKSLPAQFSGKTKAKSVGSAKDKYQRLPVQRKMETVADKILLLHLRPYL